MLSKGVQFMLLSGLGYSVMQLSIKFLHHVPTGELVFIRSAFSLLWCATYLKQKGIPMRGHNEPLLLARGVFGAIALVLFYLTIKHIPLATAVTLNYLSPIFTVLFGVLLLRERMKPIQWLFFALAFAGVWMIKGFDGRVTLLHLVYGVLSAVFAALAYICVRQLRKTDEPMVVVLYFAMMGTIVGAVWTLWDWSPLQWQDWLWVVVMVVGAQAGQVFLTKSFHAEVAQRVSAVIYLGSFYAMVYGYFFFGEAYPLLSLLGILLIVFGVVLNVWYK